MLLGLDLGSTTVKYVLLDDDRKLLARDYRRHKSDLILTVRALLEELNERFPGRPVRPVLSGSGALALSDALGVTFLQEVAAGATFLTERLPDADVAIELGGEDAKLLYLTNGLELRMNEACAGGTGAFIDQMATLLGVTPTEMNEEAKKAIADALEASGKGKRTTNWRLRDWNISRQRYWGAPIPVIYCDKCGMVPVPEDQLPVRLPLDVQTHPDGKSPLPHTPEFYNCTCPKCGSKNVEQDPDTLDTWFSSALWPFSTLGWPDKTPELDYFYPTDVLVTGYDIIFFWVIRMIFSGYEHMGEKPFGKVLFHGLVRDSQGRKMSKSLGNGIDPLEVIDKYGADALRYTLITGNAPGNDMRFYWERVEASRNFANKVWNASRFIMMNDPDNKVKATDAQPENLTAADKWILSKMNNLIQEVTDNMEKYELGIAVAKLNDFIWEEFCDWYIEMVKPRLYNDEDTTKKAAIWTLKKVLIDALKLLHPYMPFITEEIFCNIQDEEESIMISAWPVYSEAFNFAEDENAIETIKQAVRNIRNVRAEMNVAPSRKAKVFVVSEDAKIRDIFENGKVFFATLGYASEVVIQQDKSGIPDDAVSTVIPDAVIYIPFAELVDIDKEIERLQKEEKKLNGEIARCNGMLNNEKFTSKAPQAKIDEEKAKLEKYTQMLAQVQERLKTLVK